SYNSRSFRVSAAGYLNHFFNYIYLSPTGDQYLGFDVFRYRQSNANLYGSEAMLGINFSERLSFESNFSVVTGKLINDTYLPFIPPPKWTNELRLQCTNREKLNNAEVFVQAENHFAQNHPALFETETEAYWLLNAGISGKWQRRNGPITFSITGNNLLNKNYFDHLSRFKEYSIHNIGRNVVMHASIPFHLPVKN
ncbi:MAG: TonB-dependent receptor, partial [Chitinophagaceae bacterium]|nr:TonB-dependent receptor [Chitinophagaceae bacterium]